MLKYQPERGIIQGIPARDLTEDDIAVLSDQFAPQWNVDATEFVELLIQSGAYHKATTQSDKRKKITTPKVPVVSSEEKSEGKV